MSPPAVPTIQILRYLAERRGWKVVRDARPGPGYPGSLLLDRGKRRLAVQYSRHGSVLWACRDRSPAAGRLTDDEPPRDEVGRLDKDKAGTVQDWLCEPAPGARRSTSNSNVRGSSESRRRRRQWLVDEFGDGEHVACHMQISLRCLRVLTVDTVWADRIVPGGSYRRGNIQPGCGPCQREQGGQLGVERRKAQASA